MPLSRLICRLSAGASNVLASPYALPGYIVIRVAMGLTLSPNLVTLILSDFANLVLLLLAVEQSRQANTVEKGVVALASANPDVDEKAIVS